MIEVFHSFVYDKNDDVYVCSNYPARVINDGSGPPDPGWTYGIFDKNGEMSRLNCSEYLIWKTHKE